MASSQPAQTPQPAQMGQTSQTPSQMTAQMPAAPQKPVFTDFASI
ncbi:MULTISPECIES: hypothetical protein [unclassified Yoonia]|nr:MULTISPECIES: hypothetical protein [unclassified Yoonia]